MTTDEQHRELVAAAILGPMIVYTMGRHSVHSSARELTEELNSCYPLALRAADRLIRESRK